MKIFLTGATGYIGSRVADRLLQAGHSVVGLARSDRATDQLRSQGIEAHPGDLHRPETLATAARQADAVVHTAFDHSLLAHDFHEAVRIERLAVAALVEALAETGKALIATSATGILGDTGVEPVDETHPIRRDWLFYPRAEAEQDILKAAGRGVRSAALRLPLHVYGHGGSTFLPGWIRSAQQTGEVYYGAGGENRLSAVHVDDVAQLYLNALEKAPAGSLYHASSEFGITGRAIAEAIARLTGARPRDLSMDEATERMGLAMATFLTINNQSDASRARRELGWSPQTRMGLLNDVEQGSYRELIGR